MDPLDDIKKSPQTELKVPMDDAALTETIKDFINAETAPNGEAGPPPDPSIPEKIRVTIPPNNSGIQETAPEMMTEALIDVKDPEITDQEKDAYVKALLTETPYRMQIPLFNNQMKIDLRSRSSHEQRRVFDLVGKDRDDKMFGDMEFAMMITRTHLYCAAMMIERINEKLFSDIHLKADGSLIEDSKTMREFVKKHLEDMPGVKWTALLNAMRIFESKCAKLATMAVNEDFWKPRVIG